MRMFCCMRKSRPRSPASRFLPLFPALFAVSGLFSCATGADFNNNNNNDAGSDAGDEDAKLIDAEPLNDAEQSDGPLQDGAGCPSGCNNPPSQCHEPQGTCVMGDCHYDYRPFGFDCNDNDDCTLDDQCDGQGNCEGEAVNCARPNATGGVCVAGQCTGWTCTAHWGNCDTNWNNGCEQQLNTLTHCGQCNVPCPARANSVNSCSTYSCQYTCTGDWENCDGNWSNGCERLTGVANYCDLVSGVNTANGCGTAYCGSSASSYAENYAGNWYCISCVNCHEPQPDWWQWCNTSSGIFYDPAEYPGGCPSGDEDQVCGP